MKIIGVDNFDTEMLNDILVAEGVTEFYGKIMVAALNVKLCSDDNAQRYYKLVPDDHKLYRLEP